MDLRLHFLEAAGTIERWRTRMEIEAKAVSGRIDALVDAVDRRHAVDIVIRHSKWGIIPELGFGGSCYEKNVVTIVVAPDSENFQTSMENGEFGSMLAHELHHALRHGTVGYGATLGEAIVSEGLADHFSTEVTGCAAPKWTQGHGLSATVIEDAASKLNGIEYDHAEWFFGHGAQPRWVGYALGWRVVAAYLNNHPDETAAGLVGTHSDTILAEGWPMTKETFSVRNAIPPV